MSQLTKPFLFVVRVKVTFCQTKYPNITKPIWKERIFSLDQRDLPNIMVIFSYLPLNPSYSSQSDFFSRSFFVEWLEICQLLVAEKWTWCLGKDSKKLGSDTICSRDKSCGWVVDKVTGNERERWREIDRERWCTANLVRFF
jgi:hypothetical protein